MYYPNIYIYRVLVQNTIQTIQYIQSLNMTPNSLQDALLRLSTPCKPLSLSISELLLIGLVSPRIEIHLPWIYSSVTLFPSPDPEEEAEEGKWEVITIEKRSRSDVATQET